MPFKSNQRRSLKHILDPSSFIHLAYIVPGILLTALFVGSKNALFSIHHQELITLPEENGLRKAIEALQDHPQRVLLTTVIGSTLSRIVLVVLIVINGSGDYLLPLAAYWFLDIVVVEVLAKQLPSHRPLLMIRIFLPLFRFFYMLLLPLSVVLEKLFNFSAHHIGIEKDRYDLTEDELRNLVDADDEGLALQKDERDMIHSIFEMSDTIAREIMVPRIDMVCVPDDVTLTQLLKVIREKSHSRIPIYRETIDNIVGLIHVKDLLPLIRKRNSSDFNVMKLAHEPYIVPEQKKVNDLLREFRVERIHMAIVVDEYGGTAGLVTLEDVIEEIVGEIQDEYDEEAPELVQVDDHTYVANGSIGIDELNDHNFDLPVEENVDTLAGFLLGQFGAVPKTKSSIRWGEYEFIVERVYRRRIERVRIIKHPSEEKVDV